MNPTTDALRLQVYVPADATPTEFVAFWGRQYDYPGDEVYELNLRRRALDEEGIHALFKWKNGGRRLSKRKWESVERNYVARIAEARELLPDIEPESFLERFSEGGAIWRIFWLHCWKPDQFPIYDQHVHRAMTKIEAGTASEIPHSDKRKVEAYLTRYLHFYDRFSKLPAREVDRALWVYGRFLKNSRLPTIERDADAPK